mgnify:CR=1 FL=1
MNFSQKCDVLGQLWLYYREDAKTNQTWDMFFQYNDMALPGSYFISAGYVEAVEESGMEGFINETWEEFCGLIDIDPNGNYEDINDAWNASPNPPLEEVEEQVDKVVEKVEVKRTRKKAVPKPE